MKKVLFILNSVMGSLFCVAQEDGRMETDRPDQTESPYYKEKIYKLRLDSIMKKMEICIV
jgi:hypothetical protein